MSFILRDKVLHEYAQLFFLFQGRVDNLESPSARLVMGRSPSVGTGCFDLMLPLESVIKERDQGLSHTTDKKTQHR